MKALVTGATGFVGSHILRRLLRDGWACHVIVRPGSTLDRLPADRSSIAVHTHDGTAAGMRKIFDEARPDVVFHTAACQIPDAVDELVESNVLFSTQLAHAASGTGVTRFINTGTHWQHFENRAYSPVSLLAATKQAVEAILQFYIEARNLRVITCVLFDTYGPDDWRPKIIPLLRKTAAAGKPLDMTPGEQMIDTVHIDDVCEAYMLAAQRLLRNEVSGHEICSISSGAPMHLKKFVRVFEEISGLTVPIHFGGKPYREREIMIPWSGPAMPGWTPKIPLREGIRRVLA